MTYAEIIAEIEKRTDTQIKLNPAEYLQKQIEWYNESEGQLTGYDCKICKNRGYTAKSDDNGNMVLAPCVCLNKRAILNKAEKSGLGDVLTKYKFENYEAPEEWQKEIKNKAMKFCENGKGKFFYIGGAVGSGKSHICTAMCAKIIKSGLNVSYMLWAEESKKLKAAITEQSYQDNIKKYKAVDVLYIDDFLKTKAGENPTAGDINLAFEIINSRMMSGKTTIISSEKTLDELLEIDEGLMSRIYQSCGEYKISIARETGKNYRLKKI